MKQRVFVSWSGQRARRVATELRQWLPEVVQYADPFVSEEDIAKGTRGGQVIAEALAGSSVGIICLTPENLQAPWILFEAGALSNTFGRELVCPYLIGLEKRDVQPPLAQFQLTSADKLDTRRLVGSINDQFDAEHRASETLLDRRFERMWPELERVLAEAIADPVEKAATPHRSQEEILTEVLEAVRKIDRRLAPPQPQGYSTIFTESALEETFGGVEEAAEFFLGRKLSHPQFGVGTVLGLAGRGKDIRVTIDFDGVGRKTVVARYANLEPVRVAKAD
jgi:hypothetical protein